MRIHIDPARPGVDTDTLRCPGCRQTLTAILDGVPGLPPWHRRWATRDGIRIDGKGDHRGRATCTYNGDNLSRLVFIAQTKAEEAEHA